jgi:hypothetical protein
MLSPSSVALPCPTFPAAVVWCNVVAVVRKSEYLLIKNVSISNNEKKEEKDTWSSRRRFSSPCLPPLFIAVVVVVVIGC